MDLQCIVGINFYSSGRAARPWKKIEHAEIGQAENMKGCVNSNKFRDCVLPRSNESDT